MERVKTWIRGFDTLAGGGMPSPTFMLLVGNPGTGKSTFSIQFLLNGAKFANEIGVYASFLEREETFIRNMAESYGFDFKTPIQAGKLRYLEFSPLSPIVISDVFNEIAKVVLETGARRLVIDSLNALLSDLPAAEHRRMLEIIVNRLIKGAGCTVFGIVEQGIGKQEIGLGIEEFVADGLIIFESYIEGFEVKRRAVIRKLRGTEHSSRYQSILLRPMQGIEFLQMVD